MRRATPILAACLVLVAGFAAWFVLGTRPDAPLASEEGATEAGRAADAEGAPLSARTLRRPTPGNPAGRIRVAVLDAQGKPAGLVRVTARRTGPAYDPRDPATWGGGQADAVRRRVAAIDAPPPPEAPDAAVATDEAGTCELPVGRTGRYAVRAEPAPPRWGSGTSVTVSAEERAPSAALRVGDGTALRGRVLDAHERPVAASLSAAWPPTAPGGDESVTARRIATDPTTGAFVWDAVPAGPGVVTVTVPGRLEFSVGVTTPRAEDLVIRLAAGGLVRGRVTDPAGASVEDADVLVRVAGPSGREASVRGATARAKTAADGTYRMEDVPPGRVASVTLMAAGFRSRTDDAARARWGGAEVGLGKETVLDLVLDRGSVIEGRVVVEGTGAPLPDARVEAIPAAGRWNDRPEPVASDTQGRFRFEGIAVGRYVLVAVSATHYVPAFSGAGAQSVSVNDGEARLADAVVAVVAKDGDRLEREIRMRPGLSVRGRALGPDGSPVEGVKVTTSHFQPWNAFFRWGVDAAPLPGPETTSAEDGTFRLTGLPPGDAVTLTASRPPLTAAPTPPFRLVAGEPEPDVVVRLEVGCTVAGHVLDADGKPVGGVQLAWVAQDTARPGNGNARSEPDGGFRLEGLPPAPIQVYAWGPSQNAQAQVTPALTPGEVRTGVDLRFRRTARISGVVVDAQGQPLQGIRLVAAPSGDGAAWGTDVSRDDGTFEFTNVSEGPYTVGLNPSTSDNVLSSPREGQTVTAPAEGVRVVAKPRLETVVAGRVVRPDGSPVPLCTVRVGPGDGGSGRIGRANPDEVVAGEFRRTVDASPPFPLTVSGACGADGRRLNLRPKTITVEAAATDLVITLEEGLVVAGRVVDERGAGVAGAEVAAGPVGVVTDASGAFRVEGLSEGEVTVRVKPPAGFAAPAPATIRAGATDVVLACPAGAAITGRVVGPDGAPVTGGSVSASWSGGSAWGALGAGGAFRIEGVPVNAVVDLVTSAWDPVGRQMLRSARMDGVRAGTEGLELRLPAGVSVSGVVTDADGRPQAGCLVLASTGDGGNAFAGVTDAAGRFTVGGLAPGPVTLTLRDGASRLASPPVRTEAPATGVRLVMPRKGTIRGRVVGDGVGKFVVSAYATDDDAASGAIASAEVGADGRFSLDVFEGVALSLTARRGDDDRFGLVTPVRAGADVTLTLEAGLSIDGTCASADGRPAAGAWVTATSPLWSGHARVAADGTWRVRGLPKGTYRLTASTGTAVPETSVEAGATGVRLEAGR